METVWKDVLYAFRSVRRRPSFTLVAVLTLAIGLCFITTIFSFLNTLVLRPFPFAEPDRLVRILSSNERGTANVDPRDILDLREQGQSFAGVTLIPARTMTVMTQEEPSRARVSTTFPGFFDVLGVKPVLGRGFLPDEERPGKSRVAVISHGFWQRNYGSDPQVIGRSLLIDGGRYSIIGVAPANFEHPSPSTNGDPEIWIPYEVNLEEEPRGNHWALAIGRLKPGVSLSAAQAEVESFSRRQELAYPVEKTGWRMHVVPLAEYETREIRPALLVLLVAAGALLTIICFNLANLLLANGLARQKEIAIRTAVGAGRGRLVRQLLFESLIVAVLGGAVGLALAPAAIRFVSGFGPQKLARMQQVSVDGKVLAFAIAVAVGTAMLFGLLPALRASRVNLQALLKEGGGRGGSGGASHHRLRNTLVVLQLAFSVILLIVGGLLAQSLARLTRVDPGIDPGNVVTLEVSVPDSVYPEPHQVTSTIKEVVERLRSTPGVESAGAVNALPFTTRFSCVAFRLEGRPEPEPGQEPCAHYGSVEGDYFRTMGIRLIRGRWFTQQDDQEGQEVVVINESMGRRIWPDSDPIGQRIRWFPESTGGWKTIVGIVSDVRHRGLNNEPMSEAYAPYTHDTILEGPRRTMVFAVRATTSPESLISPLRNAVWSINKALPVDDVRLMSDRIAESLVLQRLGTGVSAAFSVVALVLAALGLMGIVSYLVNQRTHEFGIRLALGAQPRDILRLVLGQGARLMAIGLGIGLAGAFALSMVLQGVLYGVNAGDPVVFIGVTLIVALVALMATWVPARKGSRVDPVIGLRAE